MKINFWIGTFFFIISVVGNAGDKMCQKEIRLPSMGTFFEIQFIQECRFESAQLALEVRSLLDLLEGEFSLYQPQSPLSRLNQSGLLHDSSDLFRRVLRLSLEQESKTLGKFNIAVLPVLSLYRDSFQQTGKSPSLKSLKLSRALLNTRDIHIEGRTIRLLKPGMRLTLDGIVKGFAVDRIAETLGQRQIESFLLNFSGNMKWQGRKLHGETWKIQSWNPIHLKAEMLQIPENGSVASSGPEHNSFSKDQKWNHLIDPHVITPRLRWSQTTVVGPEATLCDVLSTASFLMTREQMQILLHNHFPHYQIYTVDRNGQFERIRRTL